MFTPATTASSTSAPSVTILKALATQVRPSVSFDMLPLAADTTTGLAGRLGRICGASARASSEGVASAPRLAVVTKFRRVSCLVIVFDRPEQARQLPEAALL